MKQLILIILLALSNLAWANKTVKFIVPYSAGGSTDKVARILSQELSNADYTFVIEYRLGAGGAVAANHLAETRSETAIMLTSNGLVGAPLLGSHARYNLASDFIVIDYIATEPLMMLVRTDSPIKSFRDFQQQSRTQSMSYGSAGVGTSSHLTSAIIANKDPKLVHIPFKGGASVLPELLAGRIDWTAESEVSYGTQISSDRLRPVVVFYKNRLAKYPDVPTIKEFGIDDRGFYRWHILLANNSADPAVVAYVQARLKTPQIKQKLESLGLDVTPPRNLKTFFVDELQRMKNIIRDYNISE